MLVRFIKLFSTEKFKKVQEKNSSCAKKAAAPPSVRDDDPAKTASASYSAFLDHYKKNHCNNNIKFNNIKVEEKEKKNAESYISLSAAQKYKSQKKDEPVETNCCSSSFLQQSQKRDQAASFSQIGDIKYNIDIITNF